MKFSTLSSLLTVGQVVSAEYNLNVFSLGENYFLTKQQCDQIARFKKKSIQPGCPLQSLLFPRENETPKQLCIRAGCCHTSYNKKDLCWLNAFTHKHQKAEKQNQLILQAASQQEAEEQRILQEEQEIEAELLASNSSAELEIVNEEEEDGEHSAAASSNFVHFGPAMDSFAQDHQAQSSSGYSNNINQEQLRQMDGQRCQSTLERDQILKSKQQECLSQIPVYRRVELNVNNMQVMNPTMSLCTACLSSGGCFDPIPRVMNNRLAPMCFQSRIADQLNEIESDLMESFKEPEPTQPAVVEIETTTKGIMKGMGSYNNMMGIQYQPKRDNRYQEWIKQNYNVGNEEPESSPNAETPESENAVSEIFKNNPRLAGKLSSMGISGKPTSNMPSTSVGSTGGSDRMKAFMSMYGGGSKPMGGMPGMPSMGMGGSSNIMINKLREQLGGSMSGMSSSMPSSSNLPSSDKMAMLQNMIMGGGSSSSSASSSSNPQLDMIKQMLNKNKSTSSAEAIKIEKEPEPEFTSQLHANMYKQLMNNYKLNLQRSGKSSQAMSKDLDTFKRAIGLGCENLISH